MKITNEKLQAIFVERNQDGSFTIKNGEDEELAILPRPADVDMGREHYESDLTDILNRAGYDEPLALAYQAAEVWWPKVCVEVHSGPHSGEERRFETIAHAMAFLDGIAQSFGNRVCCPDCLSLGPGVENPYDTTYIVSTDNGPGFHEYDIDVASITVDK